MAYFPLFVNLEHRKIVIAGGGKVAFRKAEKLIPFEADLTVIAPEICTEFDCCKGVKIIKRCFCDSDTDGAFAVIAATDDRRLNAHISGLCRDKMIPVNSVDDPGNCTFYFPALVKRSDTVIGISTGGKSPIFARYLREQTEKLLDERVIKTGDIMTGYRPVIMRLFNSEEKRKAASEALLALCTKSAELPDDVEILRLLESL